MVGDADDPDPQTAASSTTGVRAARSSMPLDPFDACIREVTARVEQRHGSEVERVVVGQRYASHAEMLERLDSDGRSAEEEGLVRVGPPFAVVGDGAFEVEDEQVGLVCGGNDAVGEERGRPRFGEVLGDLAAEHRVAGEGELHRSTSGPRAAARDGW